jgi:hypothetical protein
MSGELRKPHTLMRLRHWLGQLLANVKHYHEVHRRSNASGWALLGLAKPVVVEAAELEAAE